MPDLAPQGGGPGPPYRPLFKSKTGNRSGRSLGPTRPSRNASHTRLREDRKRHQRGPPCAKNAVFRPRKWPFLAKNAKNGEIRDFGTFRHFSALFGKFPEISRKLGPPSPKSRATKSPPGLHHVSPMPHHDTHLEASQLDLGG